MVESQPSDKLGCPFQHCRGHIDADHRSFRTHRPRRDHGVESCPRAYIDDFLARGGQSPFEWVGYSGEGLDCRLRQTGEQRRVVTQLLSRESAGVEMELAVGAVGHLGVVGANLTPQLTHIDIITVQHGATLTLAQTRMAADETTCNRRSPR